MDVAIYSQKSERVLPPQFGQNFVLLDVLPFRDVVT